MAKAVDEQEYQHGFVMGQRVWYVTEYPTVEEIPATVVEITEPDARSPYGTSKTIITVQLEKDGTDTRGDYRIGNRHWGHIEQIRPREES